jgi:hypothetical protein
LSKTKHLDTAIAIFKGTELSKRGKRGPVVEVTVHVDAKRGTYMVQVGSRITSEGIGNHEQARAAGEAKAEALRALGKKASVTVYK